MEDFKDCRTKDAWKVHRPPEICLRLLPQQSMGSTQVYVQVELVIKCTENYPNEAPQLRLENAKGLSNQLVQELQGELDSKAQELIGEVMVLELAQHVQDFLHKHNRPPAKSFYEQMMSNKKEREIQQAIEQKKKTDLLRKKEEKEKQQLEEEIQRRQEAMRAETKRRKEQAKEQIEVKSERASSEPPDPSTPNTESTRMTPIPMDSEQRQRARASVSPVGSPVKQSYSRAPVDNNGSYQKERKRHTSTPRVRQSSCGERSESSEEHCTFHTGTSVLAFSTKGERTVHRGKCLGHSPKGSTVYAGMDTKTGELVTVVEWELKWWHVKRKLDADDKEKYEKEEAKFMKQVSSIEAELHSMLRLHHENLIHYLAMNYQQEKGKIIVTMLTEYAGGGNLDTNLKRHIPVPIDVLKQYTTDLLESLAYLHSKAVVHKDLRASCVFLDSKGRTRVADYSLTKRLADLYETADIERGGVHFIENKTQSHGRGGKKGDIHALGILLLSLAEGHQITQFWPEVPATLPGDFQDFITKCLFKDEKHRWSAFQLLDHQFVKPAVYTTSLQVVVNQDSENAGQAAKAVDSDDDILDADSDLHIFTTCDPSGHSRLYNEFEILKALGKGGFGDVIKVRNRLDGRVYAIKRIPLNPKNKQLTRKITREVKLLSRLNHENVVRYYNSWIETSNEPVQSESSLSSNSTPKTATISTIPTNSSIRNKSLGLGIDMDFDKNVPPPLDESVEWSVSVSHEAPVESPSSSSSSEDEEEDSDVFGASFMPFTDSDSSDSIVFEGTVLEDSDTEESKGKTTEESSVSKEEVLKLQFLYIQMEYCERSTLRNCIDAGLYQDMNRVWRLFREIVEGLVHIHEQGMIHRDLKPVNIFLDSNDHVKIGDFGLATTDILSQQTSLLDVTLTSSTTLDIHVSSSQSSGCVDDSLTGKVGTALYVSPEMMVTGGKANYNQKVDIYSLGVIFFEMCYKALPLGMERVKILGQLRLPEIKFPEDFDEYELKKQTELLRWLLNHDPTQRPTSMELLQSPYMPPPQMEEAELNEVLRSTISNPQSKTYHRMLTTLFSQPFDAATDVLFDFEMHRDIHKAPLKSALVHRQIRSTIENLFQRHGAVQVNTPLLLPKCDAYGQNEQYVSLMDFGGKIVGLPYDLRVSFARYIGRTNVTFMKRYNIERVFRSKKVFGSHPKELIECAFDIVTSTPGGLVADAEVIHVVFEVINEFPALQNKGYYLRINHTSLLQAILLYCGIEEDKHEQVYSILSETKTEKQKKQQVMTRLCNLDLSEQTVSQLCDFMLETEGPYSKVSSVLKRITKTRGPESYLAKRGLHEIEAVLTLLEAMGVKVQVTVTLGLLFNVHLTSGIIFQVVTDVRRKKKTITEVLAAGHRYDKLVQGFRKQTTSSVAHLTQAAVGVSIALDRIVTAMMEDEEFQPCGVYDIIVCTLGHKPMIKEQLSVAKDLWAAGLKVDVLYDTTQSLDAVQDYCKEKGISYMVILESGSIKVRSLEKERIREVDVGALELVDHFKQKLLSKSEASDTNMTITGKMNLINSQNINEEKPSTSNFSSLNITYWCQDNAKPQGNVKRKYEAQIRAKLTTLTQQLVSNKVNWIEVIAVDLSAQVLKTMAAYLDLEDDGDAFNASIGTVLQGHARHRKFLTRVCEYIYEVKFDKKCPVIILYSLVNDSYKVLI
ncbi:eIF-2-alpha kinase GCN2 isoform X2 [Lingula anatina]|nr:eIF-2-alpha kinase GCN2 isoform X2 [Lingula anatina]|eukprot:XP_013386608.1 eIF-2-alpha kinase GCN2 isoform X2 [Lingula anatina]